MSIYNHSRLISLKKLLCCSGLVAFLVTVRFFNLNSGNFVVKNDPVKMVFTGDFLDESLHYRIIPYVFTSSVKDPPSIVTLVTHSTIQHAVLLKTLAERWNAPISLVLFVVKLETEESLLLQALWACNPIIRKHVSVHIVMPASSTFPVNHSTLTTVTCGASPEVSQSIRNYQGMEYPGNLLRNTGRMLAKTPYTFVIDVDLMPSANLAALFTDMIKRGKNFSKKTAFVVPVFELQASSGSTPETKEELAKLVRTLSARPFYFALCWKCHRPTDYEKWLKIPVSNDKYLNVAYKTPWIDPWEPFFVGLNEITPLFDERFRQYGFNRISQACETHMAGFSFGVLDNAFLVHRGFKTPDSFHSSKLDELEHNRVLFRNFKQELQKKYPNSSRTCW